MNNEMEYGDIECRYLKDYLRHKICYLKGGNTPMCHPKGDISTCPYKKDGKYGEKIVAEARRINERLTERIIQAAKQMATIEDSFCDIFSESGDNPIK